MALSAGEKIGPYLITGLLGKGGMGEVYRSRDPRLERDVAIKVLPAALAQNQDRLARFEREAKVLAALNHPNIASIYGLEELPGNARAIVMELVEGPTLADRLAHGPLPRAEAIATAQQIVAALEAAHEKGVVHRDLKPANVKAPPDTGAPVKVLDFGLATALQNSSAEPRDGRGESPTLTMGATEAGVILGTAGYMSPEQAAGKPVDKRADIWSFGVVLWEMLTGDRLFAGGQSVSHILADVLRAPIQFEKIPAGPLRELLRRCLDRDVKTRLRDIGEARVALERAGSADQSPTQSESRSPKLQWAGWAVAALAISAVIALWAPWRAEPEKPLMRLEVDLGADVALPPISGAGSRIMISPDGTRLVYTTASGALPGSQFLGGRGRRSAPNDGPLFIRRLNEAKGVPLSGTEGANNAFFSPDSQWVAFSGGSAGIGKVPVEGGPVVPVAAGLLLDWAEDGSMVLTGPSGMLRIPAAGGQPIKVEGFASKGRPRMQTLPGGKTALVVGTGGTTGRGNADTAAIEAVSFADGKRKVLVPGAGSPRYLPTGHLIYVSKGTLFAVPFDPDKLETHGNAVAIVNGVQYNPTSEAADVTVSRGGTLVYRKGGASAILGEAPIRTMEWIDAVGKRSPVTAKTGSYSRPRFSPDGSQLALLIVEPGSRNEWVYDLRRESLTKVTFGEPPAISTPVWSPDGRYLFVGSGNEDTSGIYLVRADGASQYPERLLQTRSVVFPQSYSKEIKRLAYNFLGRGGIPSVPLAEENGQWKAGKPEQTFPSQFTDQTPAFSPDGRWLAYATDESGQSEVNVRPASGPSRKWKVSTEGGSYPRWWKSELLYQSGDQIMSVSYTVNGDTFSAGKPRVRVDKVGSTEWDVAPDGRILVLTQAEASETPEAPPAEHSVVFLLNFFDELRRRAPVK